MPTKRMLYGRRCAAAAIGCCIVAAISVIGLSSISLTAKPNISSRNSYASRLSQHGSRITTVADNSDIKTDTTHAKLLRKEKYRPKMPASRQFWWARGKRSKQSAEALKHFLKYGTHQQPPSRPAPVLEDADLSITPVAGNRSALVPNVNAKDHPPFKPNNATINGANFEVWGDSETQDAQRLAFKKLCDYPPFPRVESVDHIASLPTQVEDEELLYQKSFTLNKVGHDVRVPSQAPADVVIYHGDHEGPVCDLRKCDQSKFPFIYMLLTHRNRIPNTRRLIESLRNATERCDPPPWLSCVCFLITDYDTTVGNPVTDFASTWPGHVRVARKTNPTDPWIKAQLLVFGQENIVTPPERSLVFHVDADLYMVSDSIIDRGLYYTQDGQSSYCPILKSTDDFITDPDDLWELWQSNKWRSYHGVWWRAGGSGMIFYYLHQGHGEFRDTYLSRTKWGHEDWAFYARLSKKTQMKRAYEPMLVHIYHDKVPWEQSSDGITATTYLDTPSINETTLALASYELCKRYPTPVSQIEVIHKLPSPNITEIVVKQESVIVEANDPRKPILTNIQTKSERFLGCDLRKCDASKFPYMYMMIATPSGNIQEVRPVIESLKESNRCESTEEAKEASSWTSSWHDCACIYVLGQPPRRTNRIDSGEFDAYIRKLDSLWPGRIRSLPLASRRISKPSKDWLYGLGDSLVTTPKERSLVMHIPANAIFLTDEFILNTISKTDIDPEHGNKIGSYFPHVRVLKEQKKVSLSYLLTLAAEREIETSQMFSYDTGKIPIAAYYLDRKYAIKTRRSTLSGAKLIEFLRKSTNIVRERDASIILT